VVSPHLTGTGKCTVRELMGVGVWEEGASEGRAVRERRGARAPRASGRTSLWWLVTREAAKPTEAAKQMTALK
jgi:hypothetical protein